jgi:hypothetical protein
MGCCEVELSIEVWKFEEMEQVVTSSLGQNTSNEVVRDRGKRNCVSQAHETPLRKT